MLYHWYNTPMPALLVRLPASTGGALLHTLKIGRPDLGAIGFARGVAGIVHEFGKRNPVQHDLFSLARELVQASQPLESVEPRLPPMRDLSPNA